LIYFVASIPFMMGIAISININLYVLLGHLHALFNLVLNFSTAMAPLVASSIIIENCSSMIPLRIYKLKSLSSTMSIEFSQAQMDYFL